MYLGSRARTVEQQQQQQRMQHNKSRLDGSIDVLVRLSWWVDETEKGAHKIVVLTHGSQCRKGQRVVCTVRVTLYSVSIE